MSGIHESITELIGNTPLVRAPHYLKAAGVPDADIVDIVDTVFLPLVTAHRS